MIVEDDQAPPGDPDAALSGFTARRETQYFYGVRNTDDAIMRRTRVRSATTGQFSLWSQAKREYLLNDANLSVVAITDEKGIVRKRAEYDSYGQPLMRLAGDLNGDGLTDDADFAIFTPAYDVILCSSPQMPFGESGNACPADLNEDGSVDDGDFAIFAASYNELEPGPQTGPLFAGYWRDDVTGYYQGRMRWYDPQAGRWLTRDPAGYVDGLSLYLYVKGNPWSYRDPTGLAQSWYQDAWDMAKYAVNGNPAGTERYQSIGSAAAEGAAGGASIQVNAVTHGLSDAVGLTNAAALENDSAYDGSRMVSHVTQAATDGIILGGAAKLAECGTVLGETAKVALEGKAAYDKAQSVVGTLETGVEAGRQLMAGDTSGALRTVGGGVMDAGSSYLGGKVAEKLAGGIPCFEPGTPVQTPTGFTAIETLGVGDRVWTPGSPDASSDIDAASWRLYELELVGDPSRHGVLQILRPAAWQERVRHDATGSWLPLEIAEWNLHGEARLLSVKPCPPIQPGPGRVVLMKSTTRYTGELATLRLIGSTDAIEGTCGHPIFSLDRGSYVPLGDLRPGEHVRTADGWALVESLARTWGVRTVHNLEVDAEHRFYVGEARVESHNAGGCDYSSIPNPRNVGPGKPPTPNQRKGMFAANREQNGGVLRSDESGIELVAGKKSQKGVTPHQMKRKLITNKQHQKVEQIIRQIYELSQDRKIERKVINSYEYQLTNGSCCRLRYVEKSS